MSPTATGDLARRIEGDDPFRVEPTLDLLHRIRSDVPGWSETAYVHIWNPDARVGVFVHFGRCARDLALWWAQVVALLPDGRLIVDRSFGRSDDARGPATGTVALRCLEPGRRWSLRMDGAGEATTTADTASSLVGAGPAVPLALEVELTALAPVWDLHAAAGVTDLGWAAVHHHQGFRSTGCMRAEGRTWPLDGVAQRDHSSGPRDVSGLGGLTFLLAVFPETGRVVNALRTADRDGTPGNALTGSLDATGVEIGTGLDAPGLDDLATLAPRTGTVSRTGPSGAVEHLQLEVLHGYVLTMLDPNENLIGAALDAPDDPLLVTQATVRLVDGDGAIGYGVFERDVRRSLLTR